MRLNRKGQTRFSVNWLVQLVLGVFILILMASELSIPTGESVIDLTNTSLYNNSYINDAGDTLGGMMTDVTDDTGDVIGIVFTVITIGLFLTLTDMI